MALNPYNPTSNDSVKAWARIHGNGEQTHVHVLDVGDDYIVVAVDIDPRDYEPVASDLLAYDPTLEGAVERAQRWMESNPKGIAGGDGQANGSGGSKLMGALKKLNDYGNSLADQQQHQEHDDQEPQQQS